jgi:ribosome-associated protein
VPDDDRSARQLAQRAKRRQGDHSSQLARTLMNLRPATLARLAIDDDLRTAIERARAVTSPIARRRAERALAGDLRGFDLDEIEAALGAAEHHDNAEARRFHAVEQWRDKLVEGGMAAAADFPGEIDAELPRLVDAAQRERTTGKPPGAGRALFRHLADLLAK